MDLILLTGLVDDRLVFEELNTRLATIERRLRQLSAM
jgi:hypothetical protein